MAEIYVSGPVIGASRRDPPQWVSEVYQAVLLAARSMQVSAAYPEAESELEAAMPQVFFKAVIERITAAQVAVVAFTAGDVSSGMEASIAASMNKPILLVSEFPAQVPRLLSGLPSLSNSIRPGGAIEGGIGEFFHNHFQRQMRFR
jgi:hypothetical protein